MTLFLGDMAYDLHYDDYKKGEQYYTQMSPLMSHIPFMYSYGNHDAG